MQELYKKYVRDLTLYCVYVSCACAYTVNMSHTHYTSSLPALQRVAVL